MNRSRFYVFCLVIGLVLAFQTASAQTQLFKYQGILKDGGNLANGTYEIQASLWDAPTGGNSTGGGNLIQLVPITNGVFTVELGFSATTAFNGADRYLELRVRQQGIGPLITLTPRQQVTSSPYSIKSLLSETTNNALSLGGIAANQYVTTTSGGANFIQNTTTPQASSNFNISGNGRIGQFLEVSGASLIRQSLSVGDTNNMDSSISIIGQSSRIRFFQSLGTWEVGNLGNGDMTFQNFGTNPGPKLTLNQFSGFVGIGTTTPQAPLHVNGSGIFTGNVGIGTTAPAQTLHVNGIEILSTGSGAGFKFRNRGGTSPTEDWVWYANANIARLFNVGQGDVLTIQPTGEFAVNFLGSAGSVGLCRNASNQISTCSSSLRYKTNINPFASGLDLISRLRPVSFNWLTNNQFDFGLVAEEVAEIEPLLVSYNDKGEIEGVKYDRLGVVLINSVNEQQTQIHAQQKEIDRLHTELAALKMLVCAANPSAELCRR